MGKSEWKLSDDEVFTTKRERMSNGWHETDTDANGKIVSICYIPDNPKTMKLTMKMTSTDIVWGLIQKYFLGRWIIQVRPSPWKNLREKLFYWRRCK